MADANVRDLQAILEEYWKRILRRMGVDESTPMPPIAITREVQDGAAGQWNPNTGRIEVDPDWLKGANPKDLAGFLVHEGAHAAAPVDASGKKGAGRQIEPLADAIRYELTGTAAGWEPSEEALRLSELSNLELRFVSQALATGQFSNKLLKAVEAGNVDRAQMREAVGRADSTGGDGTLGGGIGDIIGDIIGGLGDSLGGTADEDGGGIEFDPDGTGAGDGDGRTEAERRRERQSDRNQRASYTYLFSAWGIPITENLEALIDQGANQNWSTSTFLERFRQTKEYRERFRGIFDKNGTLKYDESTYLQYEQAFTSIARQSGINIGPKRLAFLFRNDQTPDEFADRATAMGRLRRSPELYAAFKRELIQGGLAKPGELDKKALFKTIMGEAPKEWYDLWQDTVTRNAAITAGLTFKKGGEKYTNLGHSVIERISRMDLSEEEMAAKFTEVADVLENVLPTTEAGLYGVNKRNIVKAEFGGKGAASARRKINRAIDTAAAFYEDRASSAVYDDGSGRNVTQGVTDTRRRAQSDY
jgi:hypothetical protein